VSHLTRLCDAARSACRARSISRLRTKSNPTPLVRLMGSGSPSLGEIDELAGHIVAFVMEGAKAVGRQATTGDNAP